MIHQHRGKTKIVCTLGPSSGTVDTLIRMVQAGMDVARLNFSHGTYDQYLQIMRSLREAGTRTAVPVAILQDLQGPKIRIGGLETPAVALTAGARFSITTDAVIGNASRVSTDFAGLPNNVRPGETILIDDGKIRLRVVEVKGAEVLSEVVVGGMLLPHKGLNLPGVPVNTPSLTPKDLQDLTWGMQNGVDYVALSFVRSEGDIRELRQAIRQRSTGNESPQVIAKIEKPQAVANLDAIIAVADGVMVARGDLGVELPPEEVPVLQKRITRKCHAAGKPVIIATQMLESMIQNPAPTRAETSDVANAVVDGADAVMLSGETSVGKYPLETVEIMQRIILTVEADRSERSPGGAQRAVENRHDALARAACLLAEQMKAAGIVTVTHSGQTARALARYRPDIPIIAVTDNDRTLRQLTVVWGVRGLVVDNLGVDSDRALESIQERLVASGSVKRGEYVVLLAGQPFFARGSTNFIKVERIL